MVDVDREKAGRLGVSMQAVNDTLNDAFGQRQISTIYGQANQYRVILEADAALPARPVALSKLYVPANVPTSRCDVQRAEHQPRSTRAGTGTQVPLARLRALRAHHRRRWRSRTRSSSRR